MTEDKLARKIREYLDEYDDHEKSLYELITGMKRRIAELEEEVSQLRYERAQAGKRAMEAEARLEDKNAG